MANANRGEVSFRVDGKEYTLRYSTNALCELEDKLDLGIHEIAQRLANKETLRLKMVRAVLWAGLRDHHPDLTIEEAGELVSKAGMVDLLDKVGEAFTRSFGGGEGTEARPPAASAASGTG